MLVTQKYFIFLVFYFNISNKTSSTPTRLFYFREYSKTHYSFLKNFLTRPCLFQPPSFKKPRVKIKNILFLFLFICLFWKVISFLSWVIFLSKNKPQLLLGCVEFVTWWLFCSSESEKKSSLVIPLWVLLASVSSLSKTMNSLSNFLQK